MFLRKEKNGYYYIYFMQKNGKRNKITTKTKNINKASIFYTELKSKYENGNLEKIIEITIEKFTEIIYNNYLETRSFKTASRIRYILTGLQKRLGKDIILKNITSSDIENYIQSIINNLKPSSLKDQQSKLKLIFDYAKRANYIEKSFRFKEIKIKVPERIPIYFSKEQFEEFIKKIEHNDLRDLVIVAYLTGMRQGELIKLKWRNIDFNGKNIKLDNITFLTKNRKARTIPTNNYVLNILKERYIKCANDYVFTRKTKTGKILIWEVTALDELFKKFVINIFGTESKLTFHSLRHGFATSLLKSKAPLLTISKLLGHSKIETTIIYTHLENEDLKNEVDKINIDSLN